ncbi:GntR family transcriptional regulator [Streptomyces sp. S3(2020)]|uniref:GntR family transcriptional regulator n=1 Tax=Streptomyces sp. S3(2020) TaxID=2732044 RepID=UPI001489B6C5|nr:GntR family transcriptional regulator [Streptomyces sp. S3(2020)]NNN32024.1 GntR family transcriptional regulator [Streptomyces sp. S3(2020)]
MRQRLAEEIGGTVRQRAERELRDRILTGALPAGTRLDLDRICEEFGISRTPVREALLELSFQGLVEVAPRSRVIVVGATPEETLDNFAILATLSGKAAEWAARRITPSALGELEDLAKALPATPAGPDLIDANWRFHHIVNTSAGVPHLLPLLRQAVRLIPSNFLAVIPVHNQQEHDELLDCLREGNAGRARTVAEQHVLAAGEALTDWLRARVG